MTDKTGTGAVVFQVAPTLINPVVSTQSPGDNSTKAASTAYADAAAGAISHLVPANNLSDVVNAGTSRTNLGLGTASVNNIGTSGATVPLLNATNTWSGDQAHSGSVILSGSAKGVGYGTGAGGTVTQATSKATGVSLNAMCGQITMNGAALGSGAVVTFSLTNSSIASNDILLLNHGGVGTAGGYALTSQSTSGAANINVRNATAGSLSEAIIISFAVIKAAVS